MPVLIGRWPVDGLDMLRVAELLQAVDPEHHSLDSQVGVPVRIVSPGADERMVLVETV
jgi:hypothetical protein